MLTSGLFFADVEETSHSRSEVDAVNSAMIWPIEWLLTEAIEAVPPVEAAKSFGFQLGFRWNEAEKRVGRLAGGFSTCRRHNSWSSWAQLGGDNFPWRTAIGAESSPLAVPPGCLALPRAADKRLISAPAVSLSEAGEERHIKDPTSNGCRSGGKQSSGERPR